MIGGLFAGYVAKAIKQIKLPASMVSLMPVLVIPLFGTFIVGLGMTYVLGGPVTWLNQAMTTALNNLSSGGKIILGLVQGAMLAFDMGGPVNKQPTRSRWLPPTPTTGVRWRLTSSLPCARRPASPWLWSSSKTDGPRSSVKASAAA